MSAPSAARPCGCDYCGLPVPAARRSPRDGEPVYCCLGCRFAAQVTRERGEEGATRWALTRLGVAVFFTMNVVMLSMALWSGDWYATSADALSRIFEDLLRWGSLLCAVPVLLLLGMGLAENAAAQFRRGTFSTDALLLSGVVAAYLFSAVSVLRGQGQIYFEVGCVVLVMVTLGRWFEATGRLKASAALEALERLLPEQVRRLIPDGETLVPLRDVRQGDRLRILPGERFPTDGQLDECWATVDEQFLTGESWPVSRRPGDAILGGSLNLDGAAILRVTAPASEGTLSRLIALVREARQARGRWQRLADRVSSVLFPMIALVAVAAGLAHWRFHSLESGLLAGLAVTLIACPCALGLATPLAVWNALGAAAQRQVLFRSGDALERLASIRIVCFDKTGTLTTGEPELLRVVIASGERTGDVESVAARMAAGSSHVLSQALLGFVGPPSGIPLAVQAVPGKGLRCDVPDRGAVSLGSAEYLRELGLALPQELESALDLACKEGRPVVLLGWQGQARGLFVFRERLRDDLTEALRQLHDLGCETMVLTGDHAAAGQALSNALGIPVLAGLLPHEKLARLQEVRRRDPVAMVGDGVNDAPALAAADVGIAMGCGADVSRDSAGICLLGNDLTRIPWAIQRARATVRTIRHNLFWAFAWNLIGVALAAAGLLNPALAAFAMIASSALVISNSLRGSSDPEAPRTMAEHAGVGFDSRIAVPEDAVADSRPLTGLASHSPQKECVATGMGG